MAGTTPDILTQQEAVIKMAVAGPEGFPSRANKKDVRQVQFGKDFRQLVKNEPPEAVLTAVNSPPVDKGTANAYVEQFGFTRGPKGEKQRVGPEQTRYTRAVEAQQRMIDLLDKGFDRLKPKEQSALRSMVVDRLKANPDVKVVLGQLAKDRKLTSTVDNILNDPRFQAKIREELHAIHAAEPLNDATIHTKQDALQEARMGRDEAKQQATKAKSERIKTEKTIAAFKDKSKGKGKELAELSLKQNRQMHDAERQQLQDKLRVATDAEAVLQQQLAVQTRTNNTNIVATQADLQRVRTEAHQLRDQIATCKATTRESLQAEKDQAEQSLPEHKRAEAVANREYEKKRVDVQRRTGEYADAVRARSAEEKKRMGELEEAVGRATEAWVSERQEVMTEKYQRITELKAEEADKRAEAGKASFDGDFYRHIHNRWDKQSSEKFLGMFGKRYEKSVPNKDVIRPEADLLMKYGPKALMVEIARDLRPDAIKFPPGVVKVEELLDESNGWYDPEAFNRMYQDLQDQLHLEPDAIAKMEEDIGTQLLARKITLGGLRRDEVTKLGNTEWGKQAMLDAVANNKAIQDTIDQLAEQGGLRISNIKDRTLTILHKYPWLFAALIMVPVLLNETRKQSIEDRQAA